MTRTRVIVFDSNETLLDLSALDPHFARAFGDASARDVWFKQVLQLFLTATVIDAYQPFDVLGDAALDVVATQRGRELAKADRSAIHAALLALPPHADVRPALDQLRAAKLPLAVLTNSTKSSATAQMQRAGLTDYFDAILSADAVARYKPAREAYAYAAKELNVGVDEIRLVAAHGWDVAGALAAGGRAAFVARPGQALNPNGKRPDVVGRRPDDVAAQIVKRDA
jgi:2-haloacid dehalogenase